jgi:lysophospholipase L1-like esterase
MSTSAPTSGWSSVITISSGQPGWTYTVTPAAGGSVLLQWSADNVNWVSFSDQPWTTTRVGGIPSAAVYVRGMSFGAAGTFDVTARPSEVTTLTSAQAAAVTSQALSAQSIAAPYRLASFGDSRANALTSTSAIGAVGSGGIINPARTPSWVAAYLGDTDYVASFGVSGDTLISSSSSTGWNGPSRTNSKTIANLIAGGYDAVVVEYGINDLPSATSANLVAAAKSMVSEFVAAGIKVVLCDIMIFDPTAATPNITPANAAATLVKINDFTTQMSAWMAGLTGRAVFSASNSLLTLASTGYGDPQYFTTVDTLGVHPNKRGAQIRGQAIATALRTILPAKNAKCYTAGPLYQPNLIDWMASGNLFAVNNITGTSTAATPTWNIDATTGVPYAECVFTPTALASGTCQFALEIQATGIAGATPTWPIAIGDVMQGSARLTYTDGSGNAATGVQGAYLRHRLFNNSAASQFFADWGGASGASDLNTMPLLIDGRFATPLCASPIASATIATPSVGSGYYLRGICETTTLNPVTVRLYAPALRVVSKPQPVSITPGASPYVWQNNPQPFTLGEWVNAQGRDVYVSVQGGTVSAIGFGRGPTSAGSFLNAAATGATSGTFLLKPGDGIVVTYSVAPTMFYWAA